MPRVVRLPLTQDQAFLDLLLLLRFGAVEDFNYQHPVVSVNAVARVVGNPASTIAKLLKLALCAAMLGAGSGCGGLVSSPPSTLTSS